MPEIIGRRKFLQCSDAPNCPGVNVSYCKTVVQLVEWNHEAHE